jgi:hypothetical protein
MNEEIRKILKKRKLSEKDISILDEQMDLIIKKYCDGCESIKPRKSGSLVSGRRKRGKKGF